MAVTLTDFPCGQSCLDGCSIRTKMIALQKTLIPEPEGGAADVVHAFLASYRELCKESNGSVPGMTVDVALPALFDLVMSAKYAEEMVADAGWAYCEGTGYPEGPALYFPYLRTCPRCSVHRGILPAVVSHKPGSDKIGRLASDVNTLIMAETIRYIAPGARIAQSSNRTGDVDIVIYTDNLLVLAEIKSSPLAVYPLEISLPGPLTVSRGDESVSMDDHVSATPITATAQMSLYVPHKDMRIPLGERTDPGWPYSALETFVKGPEHVSDIITAWKELYDVYAGRIARGPVDTRRWITCGCGSGVDDAKNAPGMDRSDDLKKGTYQVLKLGAYYKEKCLKRIIRAALISNILALRGYERYLAEVEDILWTKAKFEVLHETENGNADKNDAESMAADRLESEDSQVSDTRTFRSEGIFYLFDALLCLTRSIYRDEEIRQLTSLDAFAAELCK